MPKTFQNSTAFLALWNNVDPSMQSEYEVWHCFEHVPERTALPDFIQTRRYRSIAHPLRYFTCYEVAHLGAFESNNYKDVMANPTPWSARMRASLQNFVRLPCTLLARAGQSSASQLVTLVFDCAPAAEDQVERLIQTHAAHTTVVSFHLGRLADMGAYAVAGLGNQASNQLAQTESSITARYVLMLQGIDAAKLLAHTQILEAALQKLGHITTPAEAFELLSHTRQDDLPMLDANRQTSRLSPRMDLYKNFPSFQTNPAGDTP
jgi:hypothetical protein